MIGILVGLRPDQGRLQVIVEHILSSIFDPLIDCNGNAEAIAS